MSVQGGQARWRGADIAEPSARPHRHCLAARAPLTPFTAGEPPPARGSQRVPPCGVARGPEPTLRTALLLRDTPCRRAIGSRGWSAAPGQVLASWLPGCGSQARRSECRHGSAASSGFCTFWLVCLRRPPVCDPVVLTATGQAAPASSLVIPACERQGRVGLWRSLRGAMSCSI